MVSITGLLNLELRLKEMILISIVLGLMDADEWN